MIPAQYIKDLREKTGAGVSDVKRALEESGGDMARAEEIIGRKLGSSGGIRAGRETGAGIIEAYIHSNARIGAMVELLCETDFVARSPQFKALAHDLDLHIAAMRPVYISSDDIPSHVRDAERARAAEEVASLGKPDSVKTEIIDGKVKAYFSSITLLEQPFVKEQNKRVKGVIDEAAGRFGENIKIGKFIRFEI